MSKLLAVSLVLSNTREDLNPEISCIQDVLETKYIEIENQIEHIEVLYITSVYNTWNDASVF